jgi:hypothetical protein
VNHDDESQTTSIQAGTGYKSWGKGNKIDLRCSKTGESNIEKSYATHFVKKSGVA